MDKINRDSTEISVRCEQKDGNIQNGSFYTIKSLSWMELTVEFFNLLRAQGYRIPDDDFMEAILKEARDEYFKRP